MGVKQLTAVSLFAGVGGFDLALERNGVKVVASVEIDKKASAILAKQFPNSKLFNDIKGVTGEQLINAGFDPENGIITGGFPCQDLSVAGKRAGLDGNRSGLFYEIVRLLDETKARYFILENVVGLLSSNSGADMGAVIGALVERGYGVAYRILDAQYFGVPQRRRRVFIVGCAGDSGRTPAQVLALTESSIGHFGKSRKKKKDSTESIDTGIEQSDQSELIYDVSHRRDVIRIYENTTPTLSAMMGTGGNNVPLTSSWWDGTQLASTLTVKSNEQRMPDKNQMQMVVAYPMHGAMVGRKDTAGPNGSGFLGENEASYTLTASNQSRHGVAVVFEPKSAFEENWAESTVKNALRANASKSSHAIIHNPSTFANYIEQEVVGTLRAGMPRGSEPLISEINSVVRRLTPVECERLQGFPDDWTSGQADQHRYKQMGNAVAVPVVEWIVKRLVGAIND
jgi:DNA (cytosine-5)-methyltransferase 1